MTAGLQSDGSGSVRQLAAQIVRQSDRPPTATSTRRNFGALYVDSGRLVSAKSGRFICSALCAQNSSRSLVRRNGSVGIGHFKERTQRLPGLFHLID
jgi:hypothetical protein